MEDQECVTNHRAMIYDRGGFRRVSELVDLTEVRWTRVRDSASEASVRLVGRACHAQADRLREVESSRHELVIFRGTDRVWEGPIRQVQTTGSSAEIFALDVKEYLDYTSMSVEWEAPGSQTVLMGDRLEEIIVHELTTPYGMTTNSGTVVVPRWETISTPINVLPHLDVRPGSIYTTAGAEAFEMKVGEFLDDRADGGLDYTTVGRRLIIWDSAISLGRTRTLTDADFEGDIILTQAGDQHVSISHLSASRDEDDTRVGHAGGENDYYGVWETIVSQQSESGSDDPNQTALNSQAQRALTHKTPVPLEMSIPAGLRLSDTLSVHDLVPGAIMPVLAGMNIRPVSQDQMLDQVTVTEGPEGESISVKLSPWGDIEGAP